MVLPTPDPPRLLLTVPDLCEQYRHHALTIRNVSAGHVDQQLTYVKRLLDFLGLPRTAVSLRDVLNEEAITAFLIDYAPRYGPESRRQMHVAVRTFLRFAYEERLMPLDLSAFVPTVRKRAMGHIPRALAGSCIAALESSIDRSCPAGRRDAAVICLLSTYGVRGIQIRRLCLEHVDWENGCIHFPAAKGGHPVKQHLTSKAGNRLADYIVDGRPQSPYREVFLTLATATPLPDARVLWRMIDQRLRAARISVPKNVSRGTNGFRHAFATRMTGKVPFKDVADMLGHRSPSSTLVYAKVDVQTLRQAALPWPGVSA